MRLWVTKLCLVVCSIPLTAQVVDKREHAFAKMLPPSPQLPALTKDLPVRRVVLYKNGVGYFEHAGTVSGNQRVTIDFTSPQLNDVLQSLTVLDEGGGRECGFGKGQR